LLVREAFVLKLVGQLTIPELAIATESSEDSVRDLLRQALCGIRDAISDTEDYARALR
jgi:DNA-directed RNA polymerase specialized sigma24 family protein